jgi:hypothetical protein
MTLTPHDPVHTYLISRGCSPTVVRRGLSGMLEQWNGIVASVERGSDMTLDEWLNDMDLRDILAGALASAETAERRAAAIRLDDSDERFHRVTTECPCVWGADIAETNSWRAEWQWWYFRRPVQPQEMLKAELVSHGLMVAESP